MALTLVTGPLRSGKSRYAAALAQASGGRVRYVATLSHPALLELFRAATGGDCVVVDGLGSWLAARIATNIDAFEDDFAAFESRMDGEAADLALAMLESRAQVIVVAEEVGWDGVPAAASARLFRDVLGRMKQRLAARAEAAMLVVCGIVLDLNALGTKLP